MQALASFRQLGDVLEKVKRYEDYIEEVQSGVDESQRHADELQKNYVYGGHSDWTMYWNEFGGKNMT